MVTADPRCGHAIVDVRKTKVEFIAENAVLRQQLIAAKRHLGRPQLAKPEKLALTLWARACKGWQRTFLLFQPDTILRWHREMHAVTYHPTQEWTAQQLRSATFDAALLLGEEHLRRLLGEYAGYFNECRPHQGRGKASRLARTLTTLRAPEPSLLSEFWLASTTTIDERPRDVS